MQETPASWVIAALASEGFTPLDPAKAKAFTATGFTIQASAKPDAAKVTAVARFTSQDKYDHWNEARVLADRLMDVLERHGATFEEVPGHEPNWVFEAHMPTA